MPRDIPVGNGRLLITYDDRYQLRDLFYPHVGQENHAGAGPCHFGVWAETPGKKQAGQNSQGRLAWSDDPDWTIRQRYLEDALTTDVDLWNARLQLSLHCNDAVDFNRNVLVRRIRVHNRQDAKRLVKVLHHHDFLMFGTRVGDTAYYDPELRSMVHYRAKRYLSCCWYAPDDRGGQERRVDEFATGTSGFGGAEGTFRDAEDGHLGMNPIAQGAVDSTMSCNVTVPAGGTVDVYLCILAGNSRDEIAELHGWLDRQTPQTVIDRTTSYWRLWSQGAGIQFGDLPEDVVKLFKRSMLTVRTQIDDEGAIIAANDSDIMQFARDTYSYMWPRDGALVADALDLCGYQDLARNFYSFCQRVIQPEGYFLHKYNPDGSPASSWHPWIKDGRPSLPIQEDETALVVWAMWRHYWRYRDTEYIRPLWIDVVVPAAEFMCRYRDERTGLPLPSYDLWEERWGVHAFTVATVYGGLIAARNFAVAFGDKKRAEKYGQAAAEIKAGAEKYLWSEELGRFSRRLVPHDQMTPPQEPGYTDPEAETLHAADSEDIYEVDDTLDASLFAIYKFHLFEGDDPARRRDDGRDREGAVGQDRRRRRGAVHERLLPPRQRRHRQRAGQPVVHLHALARRLLHPPRQHEGGAAQGDPHLRVGRRPRPGERHAGRAGQPVHERADQRQPAHVEPRDGVQHGREVPRKARAARRRERRSRDVSHARAGAFPKHALERPPRRARRGVRRRVEDPRPARHAQPRGGVVAPAVAARLGAAAATLCPHDARRSGRNLAWPTRGGARAVDRRAGAGRGRQRRPARRAGGRRDGGDGV